ncbi:MAG: hypothetical protein LBF38_02495 [Deltaproteobacteria bacterium]|nr:hypothetical protein [Deltaproteobacteria bacterium]
MKRLIVLLFSLALIIPAAGLSAQPPEKKFGPGRPGFGPPTKPWTKPQPGKWTNGSHHYKKCPKGKKCWPRNKFRGWGYRINWGPTYGLISKGSVAYGPFYGYQGGLDYSNLKYVNVTQMQGNDGGTDYRLRLYYDRLDSKNFSKVLDDLSTGVLGSLISWPQKPMLVAHSAALEKFFIYLDQKITVRLSDAPDISQSRKLAEAHRIVKESLAALVDSVSVNGGEYVVRFKMSNGRRSPWVAVPVVYGVVGPAPNALTSAALNTLPDWSIGSYPSLNGGFVSPGPFERAGPFYYDGPDSGASLEPAKLDYNPANLYWKD